MTVSHSFLGFYQLDGFEEDGSGVLSNVSRFGLSETFSHLVGQGMDFGGRNSMGVRATNMIYQ